MEQNSASKKLTRREFIKTAGVVAGTVLTTGADLVSFPGIAAPSIIKGTTLHFLQWSSFIPQADDEIRRQAAEWGKQVGAQIIVETVNPNDLHPRVLAAVEGQSGPDIIQMQHSWPHLYAEACLEVDDLAEEVGKAYGGFYEQSKGSCIINGRWKAVPHNLIGIAHAYREDWFKESGVEKFPDTWEEYRDAGKKLKVAGHPFGQTFAHDLSDASMFFYPLLWSFGGKEVEADGKTVALNSPETLQAVEFVVQLWKEALYEPGFTWDAAGNNKAFLSEQISCTLNGASIYLTARKQFPELAAKINHGINPKGPAGRFHYSIPIQNVIMKYSQKVEAAKEFIRFIMAKSNYYKWLEISQGYSVAPGPDHENHPLWQKDPKMLPFKDLTHYGRSLGYAGPPGRAASEVYSRYIIVDLFARAVQGESPKKAVEWATEELRKIYQT